MSKVMYVVSGPYPTTFVTNGYLQALIKAREISKAYSSHLITIERREELTTIITNQTCRSETVEKSVCASGRM